MPASRMTQHINSDGSSVSNLFDAISAGDAAVVERLLEAAPALVQSTLMQYGQDYGETPLHHAAYWGQRGVAEILLRYGADVHARNTRGRTPLHVQCVPGTPDVVELLLTHGADVNARDFDGATPIFFASGGAIAQLLIDHGADLTVKLPGEEGIGPNENGTTPLHFAAIRGYADVVRCLLAQGCEVNAQTGDDCTALHLAARGGHAEVVEVLLDHGAEVDLIGNLGLAPLGEATSGGHLDLVNLLLRRGATITDEQGSTTLHVATHGRQLEVMGWLITNGSDVNAIDRRGQTPLHAAVEQHANDAEKAMVMSECLLRYGANPNVEDHDGHSPLHLAILNQAESLWRFLLDKGSRPDLFAAAGLDDVGMLSQAHGSSPDTLSRVDGASRTLLHWSAVTGARRTAGWLLERKSDPNARDREGRTPLHVAAQERHREFAALLLGHGADVNARDNEGEPPLTTAAWAGDAATVEVLVRHGAAIDQQEVDGWTALHAAASMGQTAVAEMLLSLGAAVNPLTTTGNTPLDIAQGDGHPDMASLIRERGGREGSGDA